jgi:hypothetical protein
MKINRVKNVEAKQNRWTLKINFYVNDQHHAQKRRFEWQMMNRVNQNNQLSSKSLFDDKQINYFFRSWHERKFFFAHCRRIETTNYVMKRKLITKWKKLIFRSFFVVLVKYEKNYICRMLRLNQIIYRVFFVIWINEKRKKSSIVEISFIKRSIIKSIIFSTKKQVLKSNFVIILISSFQFN